MHYTHIVVAFNGAARSTQGAPKHDQVKNDVIRDLCFRDRIRSNGECTVEFSLHTRLPLNTHATISRKSRHNTLK